MECPCDHTYVVFSRQETRTARKEYQCGECGQAISNGARHFYWAGRVVERFGSGDSFGSFRMCLQCQADWDTITELLPSDELCLCYGELESNIDAALDGDHITEDHPLVQRWVGAELEAAGQLRLVSPTELLEAAGQLRLPELASLA